MADENVTVWFIIIVNIAHMINMMTDTANTLPSEELGSVPTNEDKKKGGPSKDESKNMNTKNSTINEGEQVGKDVAEDESLQDSCRDMFTKISEYLQSELSGKLWRLLVVFGQIYLIHFVYAFCMEYTSIRKCFNTIKSAKWLLLNYFHYLNTRQLVKWWVLSLRQASQEDYELLEKLNELTKLKYNEMDNVTSGLLGRMKAINEKCE